jgi:hypothetical protein
LNHAGHPKLNVISFFVCNSTAPVRPQVKRDYGSFRNVPQHRGASVLGWRLEGIHLAALKEAFLADWQGGQYLFH